MRIAILIHNIYGLGGTNRTSLNLASALAEHHEVEIVSVYRHTEKPLFDVDPRVRLVPLIDTRVDLVDVGLRAEPAEIFPASETRYAQYSKLCDLRVAEYFERSKPDIAIGTRPGLNLYVARLAGEQTVRVGQEHVTLASHPEELRAEMGRYYGRLHAFVTVTEADADNFRSLLPLPGVRVEAIPNSVPAPVVPVSDGRSRVVVAAGRLVDIKRYDLLVEAFAKVVAIHPDWQLRIYGKGSQRGRLRALIDGLGLNNSVMLTGLAMPIEAEWVKGSIAAVTSDTESFGMTIVEAMRCGLPVVSTDCPLGPREIVRDGEDGRLVAPGDVDAIAAGLMELIGDDELRGRMAAAARRNSARFDPAVIAQRYEQIFDELLHDLGLDQGTSTVQESAAVDAPAEPAAASARPPRSDRPSAGHSVITLKRLTAAVNRRLRPSRAASAPNADSARKDTAPTGASLYASASNGLTVSFPPAAAQGGTLLLRRRGGAARTAIRVRVLPAGADGGARALVGPTAALSDGTWDLYLEKPTTRSRLTGDLLDLRELVGARPPVTASPVTARLPYRTVDGFIALKVWEQPLHAEVEWISVADGTITVTARLFGAPHAVVDGGLLRHRSQAGLSIEVPCLALPDGTVELTVRCALPAAEHNAEQDYWDLFVTVSGGHEPVQVGGWFDDIRVRKGIYVHPVTLIDDTPRGQARVRPYFNDDNGLSVNVVALPPAEPAAEAAEPAAALTLSGGVS